MTKCPYVPPHEFDLDFPHLMLRYRAVEHEARARRTLAAGELTKTDRNGKLAALRRAARQLGDRRRQHADPPLMEAVAGCRPRRRAAEIPRPHLRDARGRRAADGQPRRRRPSAARRCSTPPASSTTTIPTIGMAARAVLAHNGVETEVVYPALLRHAAAGARRPRAGRRARARRSRRRCGRYIDRGLRRDRAGAVLRADAEVRMAADRCPTMPAVKTLSEATFDIAEYVVDIAGSEGLAPGLKPLAGGVTLHIACHARAQNIGQKAAEMLRLIPEPGSAGDRALLRPWRLLGRDEGQFRDRAEGRAGRWRARRCSRAKAHVASECPLAGRPYRAGHAAARRRRRRADAIRSIRSSSSPEPTG